MTAPAAAARAVPLRRRPATPMPPRTRCGAADRGAAGRMAAALARAADAGAAPPMPQMGSAGPTLFLIYNGQRYPVTKDQFIIGRGSKTSDLPIKDGNISRKHAAVIRRNGTFYIKDLGSTNGIDYKGMRIDNKRIDEGDVFHLCDYELRFTYRAGLMRVATARYSRGLAARWPQRRGLSRVVAQLSEARCLRRGPDVSVGARFARVDAELKRRVDALTAAARAGARPETFGRAQGRRGSATRCGSRATG